MTPEHLMKQASMTAHDYMVEAVRDLDEQFGAGFAKANPALVAAMVQAAALDYAANRVADALDRDGLLRK